MNVTLIHCQSKSKIYGALPPLGLLAIASFLKRNDIDPLLIDFALIDENIFDINDIFQKSLPDSTMLKKLLGSVPTIYEKNSAGYALKL